VAEEELPDYSKSQQLEKLKRLTCVLTQHKPRVPVFLTRKAQQLDLYEDDRRVVENLKKVIRDPRTPVEKKGDRIVNVAAQESEGVKVGGR
jgi:hypothetical protein